MQSQRQGDDTMATAYELAALAKLVYHTDQNHLPGWDYTGKNWGKCKGFGFYAEAYVSSGRQFVFSIRGTDDIPRDVLIDDAQIALGTSPSQLHETMNAFEKFTKLAAGRPAFITGHSLGGALAQLLAARHRITTCTFNAPGMLARANKFSDSLHTYGHIHNIRASRDLASLKGNHAGSVESIEVSEHWLRHFRWCAAGIALSVGTGGTTSPVLAQTCGASTAASMILNQHSIDNIVVALYTQKKFNQTLGAVA